MLKIKSLTKEQILISLDRLTRFKNPEVKYLRVFKDVILSNLIEPKFKKIDLDKMNYEELTFYAQEIFNQSIGKPLTNNQINEALYNYELSVFNIDDNTKKLLKNKINFEECLKYINENSPQNLKWLKLINNTNLIKLREKYNLRYPIEKVVISEGITEEILLPEFAKIYGYDFDKNGVYMLSAGGKNQVVKLFYELSEQLKLPIYILLDNDAQSNYEEIKPKLRNFDSVHIIKSGEFEDAISKDLIKKTLISEFNNISIFENLTVSSGMVKFLEETFKHRGLHEFKKSEFALKLKENINSTNDLSTEITVIIDEIKNLESNHYDFTNFLNKSFT